jgi:hypothetical protein
MIHKKENDHNHDDDDSKIEIIACKDQLWLTLYNSKVHEIMPFTYILPDQYYLYSQSPKTFILKTHSQRQEGLFISNKTPTLPFIKKEEFILAQEFIQDTLLYREHKVTVRLYLFIFCKDGKFYSGVSDDGIVYYSRKKYKQNSSDIYSQIASFYDSKKLYKKGFPITLNYFLKEIDKPEIKNRLLIIIDKLIVAIHNQMCNMKDLSEILGLDFHVKSNGQCLLLEINYKPGMNSFNLIDLKMRIQVYRKMLKMKRKIFKTEG